MRIRFPPKKQTVRAIGTPRERGYANSVSASRWTRARRGSSAGGRQKPQRNLYNLHSLGETTDSPTEEQFTLGNIAAELELEPRRANLFGAIDDAADGPADEADGQDEPPTRPTAPPREKGVRFHCFVSERGYATSVAPKKVWPREGGYLNSVLDGTI